MFINIFISFVCFSAEEMANQRKHNGNLFYKENNYYEALKCYTEAISKYWKLPHDF